MEPHRKWPGTPAELAESYTKILLRETHSDMTELGAGSVERRESIVRLTYYGAFLQLAGLTNQVGPYRYTPAQQLATTRRMVELVRLLGETIRADLPVPFPTERLLPARACPLIGKVEHPSWYCGFSNTCPKVVA